MQRSDRTCLMCKPVAPPAVVPLDTWRARVADWPDTMDIAVNVGELRALVELAATAGEAAHLAAFARVSADDPARFE